MTGVPALTLHQPWASLIAEGVKYIETRSWPAPPKLIGEHLYIHAGAQPPAIHWQHDVNEDVPPSIDLVAMSKHWEWTENDFTSGGSFRWVGPIGAIVATARVTACVPMVEFVPDDGYDGPAIWPMDDQWWYDPEALRSGARRMVEISDQVPYGHFEVGRYGWILDDIAPTTERCPGCMGDGARWRSDDGGAMLNCRVCHGTGRCAPVPAKGRQRVWYWRPEAVAA